MDVKVDTPKLKIPEDDHTIIENRGIKSAYLGMPASEIGPDWKLVNTFVNPVNKDEKRYSYTNKEKGLNVGVFNGKLVTINFCYRPEEDILPFRGKTRSGIGAESTVEEIIHTYGQPDSIAVTTSRKGKEVVDLDYLMRGISVELREGQIEIISITEPEPDYDREWYQDIGDTRKYRSIKP